MSSQIIRVWIVDSNNLATGIDISSSHKLESHGSLKASQGLRV